MTSLAPPPINRQQLLTSFERRQLHAFIEAAMSYFCRSPDDVELHLFLVRSLVELGLGGLARELLQRCPLDSSNPAALEDLRSAIRHVPTGRVSWVSLKSNLVANTNALSGRTHATRLDEAAIANVTNSTQLFRDVLGAWHLINRLNTNLPLPFQWVGGCQPPADLRELKLPGEQSQVHVPLVLGLGLNHLVERVMELTPQERGRPHRSVFVIETLLPVLVAWLHIADHSAILSCERLHLFFGNEAVEQYRQAVFATPNLGPHTVQIAGRRDITLAQNIQDVLPRVAALRTQTIATINRSLLQRAAQRNAAYWAERLKTNATILGFASRHTTMLQYSLRDIGSTLISLGYDFRLELEPAADRPHTPLVVNQRIESVDPALVIILNNFRHDLATMPSVVPTLTWVQDPVPAVLNSDTPSKLGSLDFLCGYYQHRCVRDFGYDPSRYFSIPFFPVDERTFHDAPLDHPAESRFNCDLAYIGHFHGTPDQWKLGAASRYPTHLHKLLHRLDQLVERMATRGERLFIDDAPPIVRHEANSLHLTISDAGVQDIANFYLYRLFDVHYRLQTLQWAADWSHRTGRSFHIYGQDWHQHPTLGAHAHGEVAHGEELRQAYRGATLVIQTVPSGLNHQRTYEALASGALVISRYSPADFAGLSIDAFTRQHNDGSSLNQSMYHFGFRNLQPITFDSATTLATCAETMLSDTPLRNRLAQQYRDVVLHRMTYRSVLSDLMQWLLKTIANADSPRHD